MASDGATHKEVAVKYKHYVGSNDNGPIAVTIEASKGKKFQRAIVRTKKVRRPL